MADAGSSDAASKIASLIAASAEEVAEFLDSPAPGMSLFVHSAWNASACAAGLPAAAEAVLCRLLACDGQRCWEGNLLRGDLAGPLGDSWQNDPASMRLLLRALAGSRGCGAGSAGDWRADQPSGCGGGGTLATGATPAAAGGPQSLSVGPGAASAATTYPWAEALWTCSGGEDEPLQLVVRFVYREGPITAVRGVFLARSSSLGAGLSSFFGLAYGAQVAASACTAAAEEECARLQERKAQLQKDLEAIEGQVAAEEQRLLKEFATVLNAQKRRCRKLWEAKGVRIPGYGAGSLDLAPPVASIEQCIDRPDEPAEPLPPPRLGEAAGLGAGAQDTCGWGGSLAFCSPPASQAAAQPLAEGPEPTSVFSIPLTLGMGDIASSALPSSQRAGTKRGPAAAAAEGAAASARRRTA